MIYNKWLRERFIPGPVLLLKVFLFSIDFLYIYIYMYCRKFKAYTTFDQKGSKYLHSTTKWLIESTSLQWWHNGLPNIFHLNRFSLLAIILWISLNRNCFTLLSNNVLLMKNYTCCQCICLKAAPVFMYVWYIKSSFYKVFVHLFVREIWENIIKLGMVNVYLCSNWVGLIW